MANVSWDRMNDEYFVSLQYIPTYLNNLGEHLNFVSEFNSVRKLQTNSKQDINHKFTVQLAIRSVNDAVNIEIFKPKFNLWGDVALTPIRDLDFFAGLCSNIVWQLFT